MNGLPGFSIWQTAWMRRYQARLRREAFEWSQLAPVLARQLAEMKAELGK